MSNLVSGLVYNRAPFEDARFSVLLALADSANDDGYAYGSLVTIARKSRVSFRNTIRAIKKLESDLINNEKILKVTRYRKKGMSNDYFINVPLLETLPTFWPSGLLRESENRVTPRPSKVISKPVENSNLLGDTVENLGCHQNQNRVTPRPPIHDLYNHDYLQLSVMTGQTVENFSEDEQGGLFDAASIGDLVRFQTGSTALPKGGRYLRNELDPGGWSGAEVATTLSKILGRALHDGDRRSLETLGRLGFSTHLTIYLLWQIKRKSDHAVKKKGSVVEPPKHAAYFTGSLQKLWTDCETSIRKAEGKLMRMTPTQLFWYHNSVVLKEISLWEAHLGRS